MSALNTVDDGGRESSASASLGSRLRQPKGKGSSKTKSGPRRRRGLVLMFTSLIAFLLLYRSLQPEQQLQKPTKSKETEDIVQDEQYWKKVDAGSTCSQRYDISYHSLLLDVISERVDKATCFPLMPTKFPQNNTLRSSNCACADQTPKPLQAEPKSHDTKVWNDVLANNSKLAASAITDNEIFDVVMYGDSITEMWWGCNLGKFLRTGPDLIKTYHEHFDDRSDHSVKGLALGIAQDLTPNLLYRIQHGELPDGLQMKVIWLFIGTNDLIKGCRPDLILMRILHVVHALRQKRPDATIVINGLFPKNSLKRGASSTLLQQGDDGNDYMDPTFEYINYINHRLECFTSAFPSSEMQYFDPFPIFTYSESESTSTTTSLYFNKTLLPDTIHPSRGAMKTWAGAIVERVKSILKLQDESKGVQHRSRN